MNPRLQRKCSDDFSAKPLFSLLARADSAQVGLAGLPKLEAAESLARTIAGMPTSIWPLPAAMEIATCLTALLPVQSANPGLRSTVSAYGTRATRFVGIGVVLACIAFVMAYEAGVFATMDAPTPRASDMTSFVASHL